jgi:uncharacterized protein (TIGR03083 family)
MDTDAIFAAIAINRRAMADLLESLDAEQLATQSLCGDWDVQTVGAHLAVATNPSLPRFLLGVLRNGGSFAKANSAAAVAEARKGVAHAVATIRANAEGRFTPPLTGPRAPLTDVIVHLGDMTRPLGLPHDAPADHVRTSLEFLTTGKPIAFVGKGTLPGLKFVATDLDHTMGDGAEVRGRGIDLVMAMCGRTQALSALDGSGVDTLRSRLR